jgi:hypothetical protein
MDSLKNRNRIVYMAALILVLAPSVLLADDKACVMSTGGQFGTIDLTTGAATLLTTNGLFPGGATPAGLVQVGGTLYTAAYMARTLYTVNPASGALNAVGTTSIVFFSLGSTTTGLYALGWAAGTDTKANPSLYSIDARTAAVQQIGQNGQPGISPGFYGWTLSAGASTLYFADYENLYSIDTNSGNATVIGGTGLVVQGLAYENGKLYAITNSPGQVWTLDTSSGAATPSANITGMNVPYLGPIAPITAPTSPQILSQFAFGGGWYSALYFTNSSTSSVSFTVNFTADNGTPLIVTPIKGSSTTLNLAPHATAILEAPNVGNLNQGYATASLPAGVTGYGVFRQSLLGFPDQEAVVPLASSTSTSSTLSWDDTATMTGVAIANPSTLPVTVSLTVWNSSGAVIGTSSVALPAGSKTETFLRNISGLSGVAGNRGSAQFTVTSGSVAVLGLRFDGTAFTSIPTAQQ